MQGRLLCSADKKQWNRAMRGATVFLFMFKKPEWIMLKAL